MAEATGKLNLKKQKQKWRFIGSTDPTEPASVSKEADCNVSQLLSSTDQEFHSLFTGRQAK